MTVTKFESDLGYRTMALRKNLSGHKAKLDSIRQNLEHDKYTAAQNRDKALWAAKTKRDTEINAAENTYNTRARELEQQYSSEKSTQTANAQTIKERSANQEAELGRCRNAWLQYINAVHQSFDSNVEELKKMRTKSLHDTWENLNKRSRQIPLDRNGELEYGHRSPFFYALCHPFANMPEWFIGIRTVFLIIAMFWIAILIGVCMWTAYWDNSTESFFASSAVRYSFYCLLGYFVLAYLGGFIAAFMMMRKVNDYRKEGAERENRQLVNDIADAKAKLSAFEKSYKSIFCSTGKWNWDWRYYHLSRSEAEEELSLAKKRNANLHPSSTGGLGEYTFAINYESL